MALDREKFAQLTGSIAASIVVIGAVTTGCTITSSDGDQDIAGSSSSSSGEPSSSSSGGSSSGESSSSGGLSSGESSSSSGGSSSGNTEECLGDDGEAPACAEVTGCLADPSREGFCEDLSVVLRPAVARQVVECLRTAPTCEMGEDIGEDSASPCWREAVGEACAVDTDEFCNALVDANECEPEDAADMKAKCAFLAPALTETGRRGLQQCVGEYCGDWASYCFDPSYVPTLLPFED